MLKHETFDGALRLLHSSASRTIRLGQHQFDVVAGSKEDFDAWVAKVKASGQQLDASTYDKLAKPSADVPVTYYSGVEPGLFDKIIAKYPHRGDAHVGAAATEAGE